MWRKRGLWGFVEGWKKWKKKRNEGGVTGWMKLLKGGGEMESGSDLMSSALIHQVPSIPFFSDTCPFQEMAGKKITSNVQNSDPIKDSLQKSFVHLKEFI